MKKLFGLALLAALGAVACVEPTDESDGSGGAAPAPTPIDDSPAIAEGELRRMVEYLASDELAGRKPGTPGGLAARAFIIAEMQRCGIEPLVEGYEQGVSAMDGSANVLGIIRGADPQQSGRHVMLSAHYDHLGQDGLSTYHGADDNAAGVAISLGIACALAESPPPRSIIIANWDAEEPPTFLSERMGSEYHSLHPVVPLDQIDAVIAMDLVGSDIWPGYAGHFYLGSELSPQIAAAIDKAAIPDGLLVLRAGLHLAEEQPLGLGRQPWSDYDAFRNSNKPVLFLSNGQNKRYHTPADTVQMINFAKMALEAKYLLRVVEALAFAAEEPVFDPAGANYAGDAATVKAVLEAALAPGGLIDSLGLSVQSRSKLETDLNDVNTIAAKMSAPGVTLSEQEVRRLRDGTQHVMCLAGSTYDEGTCGLF